jgi:type IV pilus assembly protein PilO
MAIQLPDMAATLKATPTNQKVGLLIILLAVIVGGYYFYFEDPDGMIFPNTDGQKIRSLQADNVKLDTEINATKEKVKNLEALKKLNAELEVQLAKNQEYLPPQSEAVLLLKQLSDLGKQIGLSLVQWKPGPSALDSSNLYVKLPVVVQAGSPYHVLGLFFDRINKLPRIVNVEKLNLQTYICVQETGVCSSGAKSTYKDFTAVSSSFQITGFASPDKATATPTTGATKPPMK